MARTAALAALAAVAAAASDLGAPQTPPNIIFILADDLGWHDLGFAGSEIHTPNLDALASEGVRLTNLYGQPVCSPSRAAIHTGRYPIAYGLQTYVIDPAGVDYGLNMNETTLPSLLKEGGYSTAAVGKWHMGMASWEQTPTFRGYDSFHGYYSGGQDYFTHMESGGYDLHIDSKPRCGANCSVVDWANKGTFSTQLYSQVAIQKIKDHAATAPAGQPLFMYLAYQAVHAPAEVPPQYWWKYNKTITDPTRRVFAGMVSALDEGVGNVTQALRETGLMNNTLLIFVADNGGPIPCPFCGDAVGSTNFPLRGGKHSLWEGGVRVTGLVHGPMIMPTASGNVTGSMHHTDWFPTILDAAGVEYTPAPGFELHGHSAWQMLTQGAPSQRNETLLNIDPCQPAITTGPASAPKAGNAALRAGDWKLLVGLTGPPWGYQPAAFGVDGAGQAAESAEQGQGSGALVDGVHSSALSPADVTVSLAAMPNCSALWPLRNMTTQLFNISADPEERHDLSSQYPAVVSLLLARIEYYATQVQVPPYWPTATVDPASPPSNRNGTWTPWLP